MSHTNRNILPFLLLSFCCFSCHVLLLGLLLSGNCLGLTLTSSGVASGSLATGRKTSAMAQAPIAADLYESANVALYFTSKVTLDLIVVVDDFAEASDFSIVEISNFGSRIQLSLLDHFGCVMLTDPINKRQGI